MSQRADDYEEPTVIGGGAVSTAGNDDAGALLLDVIADLARLRALLATADEDTFRLWAPRLAMVREAARALPASPPERPRIGFAATAKRRR